MFHVVAFNEKTCRAERLTETPCTHEEGCTIMSKQSDRTRRSEDVRVMLEDADKWRDGEIVQYRRRVRTQGKAVSYRWVRDDEGEE